MITTINEWKQHIKTINEGGGAGISFETQISIFFEGILTKDNIEIKQKGLTSTAFSANGYDDGMTEVDTKIINWSYPELTREMLLPIKLDDGTVEEELNKSDTQSIKFFIESTYGYKNMHFGGYIRGTFEKDDIVFSQELNRDGYDVIDNNINLTVIETDGNQNRLDESVDNDVFFEHYAPIGKAGDDFEHFFIDVFNYDNTNDAQQRAYDIVINDDIYDTEIVEFMQNADNIMSLAEYKDSLIHLENLLPDELFDHLNTDYHIHQDASDSHFEDAQSNWGI